MVAAEAVYLLHDTLYAMLPDTCPQQQLAVVKQFLA